MRRTKRATGVVGTALLLVALVGVAPVAARPQTIRVDDDGKVGATSCDGKVFTLRSIQAAVDASGPGDTILVCPGTYTGQVAITGSGHAGLTLRGVKTRTATLIAPPETPAEEDLLSITSDTVTVRGLKLVARTAAPCNRLDAIVDTTGTGTVIRQNRIAPRGTDTYGACGFRTGVNVTSGGGAQLLSNAIVDFRTYGVAADGAGSRVRSERDAISFLHASAGVQIGPPPPSAGIWVANGAGGKVDASTITSRVPSGPFDLVLSNGIVTTVGANGFRIDGVTIHHADEAVFLGGSSGAIVRDSHVDGGSIGLLLSTQTGSSITGNVIHVTGNAIFADSDSTGNTISANDANGPSVADCYDQTGNSAANVQNTWTDDIGDSVPTGICTPPV